MNKYFFLSLIFLLNFFSASAHEFKDPGQEEVDDIDIGLITVYPRFNEVYTVYGHTAIRVKQASQQVDMVFNYGTFDFNKPNFIFLFLRGHTDYFLSASSFQAFEHAYMSEGAVVEEQILRLSELAKKELFDFLLNTLEPQNREYRYNFLFDNCTTRPRDLIERYAYDLQYAQDIAYERNSSTEGKTFRQLIHECTDNFPWMTFGIDLIIGKGADSIIDLRQQMFLPLYLMNGLNEASVLDDSLGRLPLVLASQTIIPASMQEVEVDAGWLKSSPMRLGIILLIHSLVFVVCGLVWKKKFRFFFSLLFLEAALAGCILAFISLASEHPCVSPNLNLLWLHPIHFIAVVGYFQKKTNRLVLWFHSTNLVLLCLILVSWSILPQELNPASAPYILCLCLGSAYFIKNNYKNTVKKGI
ncbi:membrane protein [Bacteroidales bacterium]|nr:membrane protein [Bacteroidales bacterium]